MPEGGYRVGRVYAEVAPDARGFVPRLREQILPAIDQLAREIGEKIAGPILKPISDAILRGISDGTGKSQGAATAGGAKTGSAFADAFKARVEAALRDLPEPSLGLDATDLDRELEEIRARLAELSDKRIGIDLTAADALAQLDELRARLDELGAKSPDVNVQVDAARASAELAGVQEQVDRLDGDTAHVNVDADTSQAETSIAGLSGAIVGLGPALIPIGAAATAGIAGIATAAGAGAAGLGVLTLGLSSVSTAVKGLNQEHQLAAQQAARTAATAGTTAAAQVQAANQVKSATESLALARQQADTQEIAASEAVERASYARTQADQQEAAAQKQLNDAREQAARDLESSSNRVIDTQLAAKQAALDVQTAEANYATTLKSSTATTQQKQQAALDLARAQQALIEANEAAKQAEQDNQAAQKAGVNGAPGVVAATKAIADAKHNQQQAGQALTDAERAQSLQRQQSAFTVEQAQRALENAELAQAKAAQSSGTAGVNALAKIQEQLKHISPAALAFAQFFEATLVPAFHGLQAAASTGFLPGLTAGLQAAAPLLKPFTAFVGDLAKTIGGLFEQAGKAFTSPFWTQFFSYIAQTAGPTLVIMSHILGDIATGFAGLIEAFAPVTTQLGTGLERIAAGFAAFGQHAQTSSSFQAFLRYIHDVGPLVVHVFGDLGRAVGNILQALAPVGPVILEVIDGIARFIAAMPPGVLRAVALGVGGIFLAFKVGKPLIGGLGDALGAVFSPEGAIILGIIALGAVIYEVWQHSETFRKAVRQLGDDISSLVSPVLQAFHDHWGDIQTAIQSVLGWIVDHVGPALTAMVGFFDAVVKTIQDLWDRFGKHLVDHLKTAWSAIAEILSGAFKVIQGIFEIFTGILTGKWSKVWTGLKDILDGVWKILQGVVREGINAISTIIGATMAVISEAWSKGWALIKSAGEGIWGGISDGARGLWSDIKGFFVDGINDVIRLLNDFIGAIDDVLGFFHLPKIDKIPTIGSSTSTSPNEGKRPPGAPPNARFAFGGVLPGYAPGRDIIPALLSPGEAVLRPEIVRALGPATINAWNSHAVHMKGGGILGDLGGALSSLGGLIGDAASITKKAAIGPALDAAEIPVRAALSLLPHGMFHDIAGGLITDMDHGVRHLLGISYDEGGLLQPGYQLAYNGTGTPEIVAPAQTFQQAITALATSGGGKHVEVHELHVHEVTPKPLELALPKALRRLEFEASFT